MSDPQYRVLMTASAGKDVVKIVRFIALTDKSRARNWFTNVRQRMLTLQALPQRRAKIPESETLGRSYLETKMPLTRVLYRVDEEVVYVLRVVYEPWL